MVLQSAYDALEMKTYTNDLKSEASQSFSSLLAEARETVNESASRIVDIDAEIALKTVSLYASTCTTGLPIYVCY